MTVSLRRLVACLLLLCLPLQGMAAVAGLICATTQTATHMSMAMDDMPECHGQAAAGHDGHADHGKLCGIDHCSISAPALPAHGLSMPHAAIGDTPFPPSSARFASADLSSLRKPPRLSA